MGSATADGLNLLQNLNRTGAEGDLDVDIAQDPVFDIDDIGDPIELPDGKRIYPPHFCGKPVHEIVCDLLDMQHPANSRFVAPDRTARHRQDADRAGGRVDAVAAPRLLGHPARRPAVLRPRRDEPRPVV